MRSSISFATVVRTTRASRRQWSGGMRSRSDTGDCRFSTCRRLDTSPCGQRTVSTPSSTTAKSTIISISGKALPQVRYRGHSDTETILYHLARHGIHSVQQFNGIFAFGFLDALHRKLFLVRDPFGVKPLYYWSNSRSLIFSSELRPIRALVDDSIDVDCLSELLRLRYLPAPDTLFKNIRKVRPGHIVEVDLGERDVRVREYPYVAASPGEMGAMTEADAEERYGFLLEQAIQRQLLSDVEVGILLSGGIDSALVARFAQKHAPYRVKSFTVGFSERDDADETAEARETAALIGLEHHEVRIGFPQFLDVLPRIIATVEEPLASTSVVPMFYLSELVSRQLKVVMSGQGADEAMGGYRRYRMELLRRFVPPGVAPLLRAGRADRRIAQRCASPGPGCDGGAGRRSPLRSGSRRVHVRPDRAAHRT